MTGLSQDLRYALRQLRMTPGFTLVAVFTLALGIGANTAIFSLVDGILLAALPYPEPGQLVSVTGSFPRGGLVAMRDQVHTMEVGAYAEGHQFNLTGLGEPIRLAGTMVSAELLSILGTRPELGRTFLAGEDRAGQDNFVILSHALWQERFERDPTIIGRTILLEGLSRQVVGVMPADFRFPSAKTQIWIPLHNDSRDVTSYWAGDYMPVIGRLRPGATLQQAQAEIRMFQSHVGALFPWTMPASWNADISVVKLQNEMVADLRPRLFLLLGAVALVLLIACANVANLILSRSATREREIGIRSALGAGRQRIVRQLLTESVVLASLGGLLGLVFAGAGLSVLKATLPADTPRLAEVQIDWRVLAFTATLTVLTGLVFGLAPALQSSRSALRESLNSGGRGPAISVSQRLRSSLAIGEVALAMLLVVTAGLLIRSFWRLSHVDPGFRPEHVLTARIAPNQSFCTDPQRCLAFYRNLLDQVQSLPAVSATALVNTLPLGGRVSKRSLEIEGLDGSATETLPLFWLDVVTPDYFRVMGIPLLSGRWFRRADESGNPAVAIIAAASAQKFWPGQNVIGKHIRFAGENEWRTVVGVIADVRAYDLQRNVPDWIKGTLYVPYSPKASLENGRVPAEMTIAVQTASDETQIGNQLRSIVTSLNPEVPVSELKTMRTVVSEAVSTPAATMSLFVTFAGLALLLGLVGMYGVLAFLVSRRTHEIGIRMALGASRLDVWLLVMREGAKFSGIGIALGLAGAFVVTRSLASQLYGVTPVDPFTYAGVAVVMAVVTMLACYIPARRAMRVDPLVALRYE
jgi:putative ABC transport system permease protein